MMSTKDAECCGACQHVNARPLPLSVCTKAMTRWLLLTALCAESAVVLQLGGHLFQL